MRIALIVAMCSFVLVATGCAGAGIYGAPVIPPPGMMFAQVSAPLSIGSLGNTKVSTKHGSATAENILGLIATGDCSIQAAATSAGITTIHYADYNFYNILGIYSKFTTIVYGE